MKVLDIQDISKKLPVTSPVGETGLFNIFALEDLYMPGEKKSVYTRRSYYKVSLVTGESRIHYADQTIEATGHTLVFTNPLIPYYWERISEQQSGFVCVFTEAFLSRLANFIEYPLFKSSGHAVIPLSVEEFKSYYRLFLKMYEELQGDYEYKFDLLRGILIELIHEAQKSQPASGEHLTDASAFGRIAGLFAELLQRQFPIEAGNPRMKLSSPSGFASQLNIHVNYLNKALKATTGRTTSQLINAGIVREANLLLKSTDLAVNQIAWSLGFEEPNHFSTFFKSQTGYTPSRFRKSPKD
jgi:AraC family transcriptional regulator, transcriptional activator of pobA